MLENYAEFENCRMDIHDDDWTGGLRTSRTIVNAARVEELVVKNRRIRIQHSSAAFELSIVAAQNCS